MGKYDLSGECRCEQIQVLRDEEAGAYVSDHLVEAHGGGWEASLYWCRKTGLLFHRSIVVTGRDVGPNWLRRVPGVRLKQNGLSTEQARTASRAGEEARRFPGPLIAHYIDPHGDGDIYSDPDSKVLYLRLRAVNEGQWSRPEALLAIGHLAVVERDSALPMVTEAVRTRACLNCGSDMTNVPPGRLCPQCGSGEGPEAARALAASLDAADRAVAGSPSGRHGCVTALVIAAVLLLLMILLRLLDAPVLAMHAYRP